MAVETECTVVILNYIVLNLGDNVVFFSKDVITWNRCSDHSFQRNLLEENEGNHVSSGRPKHLDLPCPLGA